MLLPTDHDRAQGRAPLGLLVFLALMTSVVALTIDAILPAMDGIAVDLAFADPLDAQYLVLVVFFGMGLAQPIFGPLSDAIGRRNTALIGWAIYGAGTLIAMLAPGLTGMLIGRFLQGAGAAGPRVVAAAIVRDLYDGRAMARVLSLVMTIFMLVPMLAPLIGQQAELFGGWRAIFILYLALALICTVLHIVTVPETLPPEYRKPLQFRPLIDAFGEALRTRSSMLYTLALSAIFSSFAAMLATAQHIYETLFALGALFPLVFASVAGMIAIAQIVNARLVMRLGMRRLTRIASVVVTVGAAVAALVTWQVWGEIPPIWVFIVLMAPVFVGAGLMFSNLTALALEPLGHISGTASAVIMSISSLVAVLFGAIIASWIDTTVVPLMTGFMISGAVVFVLVVAAERVR